MDWNLVLQIALWVFAVIGVGTVILIIIALSDGWRDSEHLPLPTHYYEQPYDRTRDKVEYLERDVTGTMFNTGTNEARPTLKGRVDMIEKHLGIHVDVKPPQDAKLIIKKVK